MLEYQPQTAKLSIPNARLGSDDTFIDNTQFLGSSQLSGCRGEFCGFDLGYLDANAYGNADERQAGLSSFRKRLVTQSATGDLDGQELSSLISSGSALSSEPSFKIPLRIMIQARHEIELVKLQLRRHRNHEAGDYVSEENFGDIAINNRLPAYCYQEVPCCANCYKVEREAYIVSLFHNNLLYRYLFIGI